MTEYKLSKAARERLEFEGTHYGESPYDYVPRLAAEALERPSNSAWWDDEMYVTHTLMFAYSPLAGDLIGESNYHTILAALTAEFPGDDRVTTGSFSHWTYSHFDAIKIRVLDKRGRITPEFAVAAVIARGLTDYPLFDEEDHSTREFEAFGEAFTSEFDWMTRGVDISDADAMLIAEWVGNNYYGHGEPGHVNPNWIAEAAAALNITIESE